MVLYVGSFVIPNKSPPADTFLNVAGGGFRKGVAFVNGFNLGRYWPLKGPQVTLYVPAPLLRAAAEGEHVDGNSGSPAHANHLWLLELEASSTPASGDAEADAPADGDGPVPHSARVHPSMARYSVELVDKPLIARPVTDPIPGLECLELDRDFENAPDFQAYVQRAEKQRLSLRANPPDSAAGADNPSL